MPACPREKAPTWGGAFPKKLPVRGSSWAGHGGESLPRLVDRPVARSGADSFCLFGRRAFAIARAVPVFALVRGTIRRSAPGDRNQFPRPRSAAFPVLQSLRWCALRGAHILRPQTARRDLTHRSNDGGF